MATRSISVSRTLSERDLKQQRQQCVTRFPGVVWRRTIALALANKIAAKMVNDNLFTIVETFNAADNSVTFSAVVEIVHEQS